MSGANVELTGGPRDGELLIIPRPMLTLRIPHRRSALDLHYSQDAPPAKAVEYGVLVYRFHYAKPAGQGGEIGVFRFEGYE